MALTYLLGSGQNYLLGKTHDILNNSFPINAILYYQYIGTIAIGKMKTFNKL
jgi:hypothetical protein